MQNFFDRIIGGSTFGLMDASSLLGGGDGGGGGSVVDDKSAADGPSVVPAAGAESGVVTADPFLGTPFAGMDPSYHGNESFSEGRDMNSVGKELVNLQGLLGRNPIVVPGKDASSEELSKYHSSLGRPDETKDYSYDHDEYKDGFSVSDSEMDAFRQDAFDAGLTQHQFAALSRKYLTRSNEAYSAAVKGSADGQVAGIDGLKKEWGDAFDQNVSMAVEVISEFGVDGDTNPVQAFMEANPQFGNEPTIIKFLHAVRVSTQDSELHSQGRDSGGRTMAPADASNALDAKMGDPVFVNALLDANDPGHAAAVAEKTRLIKIHVGA